jgi:hypothetical protein
MSASGPSVFRIVVIVLLAFVVAAVAAAGVAVHQRIAIVQWLVTEALTARGMESTRFVVEDVGLDRLVLSGVRPDFGGDLSVGRIAVRYAPLEILDRHIRRLEIEDFRFVVAVPAEGGAPSLAIPDSLLAASGDDGGANWTIGTVDLRDTHIAVEGRWTAEAVVDGTARHHEGESYGGTLRLQGSVTPPQLSTTRFDGSIDFTASPAGLQALTGEFTADPLHLPEIDSRTGRLEATLKEGLLTLRGEVLTGNGRIDLEAEGPWPEQFSPDAVAGRVLITAQRPPLPPLEVETARLDASVAGGAATLKMEVVAREGRIRLDAEGPVPTGVSPMALRGQAALDIDLAGVEMPGAPAPISVMGRALVVADDEALTVRALEPLVAVLADKNRPVAVRIFPHSEPFLSTGPLEQIPAAAEVRIAEARVEAGGRALTLGDLDATVTVEPTRQVHLRRALISDLGPPPSLPPLKLAGRATLDDPNLRFTGTASAVGNRLVVDFDGTHRVDTNVGGAEVRLHRLDFQPGEFQPQDLIIGLGGDLSAVTGRIEAAGSLRWGRRAKASDFTIHLDDLSFDLEGIRVDGAGGKVVIDRPWPLRTPPGQTLVAKRINVGAPMTDAVVRFRIDDRSRLAIEEARVDLLGGRFALGPAIFDPASDRQRANVRLTGIDMETLLAIAAIDGATASGRLGGEIPLVVSRDGFSVTDAVLETGAPGVLRYAPAVPPPALQGGGEGVSLMLEALKNFHYDVVSLAVDGQSGDEWSIKLHVEGKNPNFMDAYPFVFNLNLSGKLDEIIRTGLQSYELPARVGEGLSKERPSAGK